MLALAGHGLLTAAAPVLPNAVADTRNLAADETTATVAVLANDDNVGGATVTIQGSVTGATAEVSGQNVLVTRIGTAAGSYSLTYRATTTTGFDEAALTGSIAAFSSGSVGPIEAVNTNSLQITITVGTAARQTLIGYGWGADNPNLAQWTAPNVQKLCEDMGATVVRYFTPEKGTTFLNAHLAHWNLIKAHGIDTIFSSSFVYRTANPNDVAPNIVGAADGIDTAIDGGINPSNGWWATLQNEPDGHVDNHPTTDGNNTATQAQIRQHYVTFRNRLNTVGRSAVKVLGLEYRHPETLNPEFTEFNANGAYSGGVVQGQCFHVYDDGILANHYENNIRPQNLDLFSTETGDNGNTNGNNLSSPYTAARYIYGLNNGARVEIQHAAIGGVDGDGKIQVLLNASDGVPRNWYHQTKCICRHMKRGTVMRLCSSSDRPTNPTMPVNQASQMIIDSRVVGCQPRQFVACGKRADGRWVIAAVNFAYDAKSETTFAGGHYADAGNQQLTVTIQELVGFDRAFSAERATRSGGFSGPTTVNLKNGVTRFTLAPGETIAMTSTT